MGGEGRSCSPKHKPLADFLASSEMPWEGTGTGALRLFIGISVALD